MIKTIPIPNISENIWRKNSDWDCEIEESYSSTLQAGWTKNILH